MKGKSTVLSVYTGALAITIIGAGATMLILKAEQLVPDIGFADQDQIVFPAKP